MKTLLLALAGALAFAPAAADDTNWTFSDGYFSVKPGRWWAHRGTLRTEGFVRYTWLSPLEQEGPRLDVAVDQTRRWGPDHPAHERLKRVETATGVWHARPEGTSLGLKRLGGYWSTFRVGGADRAVVVRAVMPIETGIVEVQCFVPGADVTSAMDLCRNATDTINWTAPSRGSLSGGESLHYLPAPTLN